jgi:hypothetical protein
MEGGSGGLFEDIVPIYALKDSGNEENLVIRVGNPDEIRLANSRSCSLWAGPPALYPWEMEECCLGHDVQTDPVVQRTPKTLSLGKAAECNSEI